MYADKNLKIVVIDDDLAMTEMLKDFIRTKFPAAETTAYAKGEEALSGIYKMPDIIILDYHLDSVDADAMNGIQVLKKLKDRYPTVPVIFLSSQDKAEIASNTIRYGAYDYILKNESAFHRLEIVLGNIISHSVLKQNLGTQTFFNRLLAVLVGALILGFIITRMMN